MVKKLKKAAKKTNSKPKKKKVSAIPASYHNITPYLIVDGAMKAIEYYKKVFNAKVKFCMQKDDGKVGHAELQIGDSKFMLADEFPEMGTKSPTAYGGSALSLYLYMKDVDAVVKKAVDAGAKLLRPVKTQFYGDRSGGITDPFGHVWFIATHVEDVTPGQIKKRLAEMEARGEKHC